jgi:hypothetical protein
LGVLENRGTLSGTQKKCLDVLVRCAQALEALLLAKEEEGKLITFEYVWTVGGSLLPSEVEVKKPLMEDSSNELDDLDTTCCLEEATPC